MIGGRPDVRDGPGDREIEIRGPGRRGRSPAGSGCVWCISGAIRGLVAAEELAEWSDVLDSLSICLQVRLYRLSMRASRLHRKRVRPIHVVL